MELSTLYDGQVQGHEIGFDLRVATLDASQAGVGVDLRRVRTKKDGSEGEHTKGSQKW